MGEADNSFVFVLTAYFSISTFSDTIGTVYSPSRKARQFLTPLKERFVMYCGKCGFKIENENAHFCPKCGAPVFNPTAQAAGTQPPRNVTPPARKPASPASQAPQPPQQAPQAPQPIRPVAAAPANGGAAAGRPAGKRSSAVVVGVIIGVVVLVIVAIVVWLGVTKGPDLLDSLRSGKEAGTTLTDTAPSGEDDEDTLLSPSPTPLPTATPQPSPTPSPTPLTASASQIVLRGVPEGSQVTINGTSAPFTASGNDVALEASLVTAPCQIRVIAPEGTSYKTAVLFYEEGSGNDLDFSMLEWQSCNMDGFASPSLSTMNSLAFSYYKGFLNAINAQSTDPMVYSTAGNTADQTEHVFSDLNNQSVWDTSSFSCTMDSNSMTVSGDTVLFNVTYSAYRTKNDTGERVSNTNHRTIRAKWEDGMWKVDRIAFLSDSDFDAHKYADLD